MKYLLIVFCSLIVAAGCQERTQQRIAKFDTFDFSYSDVFSTCFSIKFTKSDTVFVYQDFVGNLDDSLKAKSTYVGFLNDSEILKLDSFYNSTNLFSFDSTYIDGMQDGVTFQFYTKESRRPKLVYVHAEHAPEPLSKFAYWIVAIKKNLRLCLIDSTISFGSVRNMYPPYVDPPRITKFTMPKVE